MTPHYRRFTMLRYAFTFLALGGITIALAAADKPGSGPGWKG